MKIQNLDYGFPMILIDDFYNYWEIGQIWSELKELAEADVFLDPHQSWSAVEHGKFLKNNKCIHLDEYYQENRSYSKIMRINRKIFEKNVFETNKSFFFRDFMPLCDFDSSLLSYYEDSHYYSPHKDSAMVTSLCWFFQEPKRFTGGELLFPEYKVHIELHNNRMVIFPGFIQHQVTEVKMEEEYKNKGLGRWCMTQFLATKFTENENVESHHGGKLFSPKKSDK
tara:strand:- start:1855 stop:2529 length:675 start_codon:yes stop_codon:yes gene_type:complete